MHWMQYLSAFPFLYSTQDFLQLDAANISVETETLFDSRWYQSKCIEQVPDDLFERSLIAKDYEKSNVFVEVHFRKNLGGIIWNEHALVLAQREKLWSLSFFWEAVKCLRFWQHLSLAWCILRWWLFTDAWTPFSWNWFCSLPLEVCGCFVFLDFSQTQHAALNPSIGMDDVAYGTHAQAFKSLHESFSLPLDKKPNGVPLNLINLLLLRAVVFFSKRFAEMLMLDS